MIKRKQRIPMRDLSTMTAEDRTTVEKNAMNGQVFNIFKVLAHHPALVKRWTPFAGHVLSKQTLPFRDRLEAFYGANLRREPSSGTSV